MSTPVATASEPAARSGPDARRSARHALLLDVAVVGLWFLASGALGALIWSQVTTLPEVTRAAGGGTLAPDQLVKQVGIDGWYFVIAAVGGLVSGILLLAWRNRDPVASVVLVVLGAGLAAWVMSTLGRALGPDKELVALESVAEGGTVSMQLQLSAPGVAWVWLVAAAVGALIQLWVLEKESDASS